MNKTLFALTFRLLLFSFLVAAMPVVIAAQNATQLPIADDLQLRLAKIEAKAEARRKELGIPGMSLAIVKDGEIIYMKGFGYRDFENQMPVTVDTQFAIGSATKSFTALSVLMSQDEGKLSLEDNPKKYLPYFKINQPDIDKNIQIRDLLSHSSGLARTDLAALSGKLTREELIKIAGEAKPTAGLRENFQYQNTMYVAAGEVVAKVQNTSWETFVQQRILSPLGMTNSNLTVAEMQRSKDFSFGYAYNPETKATRIVPTRETTPTAPAGSINSSARDMAQWLKFVLSKGEAVGKRLVSEQGFEEWLKPHQNVGGKPFYAFGWFLNDWKGMKVIVHGGNSFGFNSQVAMIPEKHLGFVLLTNVTFSPLRDELTPIIWNGILGPPEAEVPKVGSDELMSKTVNALGSEINLRHINSRVTKFTVDFVNQGLKGSGTSFEKAPNLTANVVTVNAFGKEIATLSDYFDGTNAVKKPSFQAADILKGQDLEDVKLSSNFYYLADWKRNFKDVKVVGIGKVGDEEAYKVVLKSEKASDVTLYVSTKSFLPLKRSNAQTSLIYADYREVDGVILPYKWTLSDQDWGDLVISVKEIKHNVKIDDAVFKP
nr:beta-lactamase [uncultured bacterium]